MVLDLQQLVADKVHGRFEELNGTLEQLVAQAVDRELEQLVAQAIDADCSRRREQSSRQRDESSRRLDESEPAAAKVCNRCMRTLDITKYEKGRNVCRECRRDDVRRGKVHQEPAAAPLVGAASTGSPPANPAN